MKLKLLHYLIVILVTLAVLSPELAVFEMVWEQHIILVKKDSCESKNNNLDNFTVAVKQDCRDLSHNPGSIKFSDANFTGQILNYLQTEKITNFLKWFFFFVPICLWLLIIMYDRYIVHRATVFQQQVEMLERLWQQSIEQ